MGHGDLDLLDWRRRVAQLYREVRDAADPAEAHVHWVEVRSAMAATHPQSAARSLTLRHAAYDPSYRFVAPLEPAEPQRIEVPTATDGVVPFDRIGRVVIGDLGSLDVWWLGSYGGGLWVPVRAPGTTTYGGGRYVLDTVKGADLGSVDDALVVDLNFAYNPSCAYDEAWACPLPPPGNVLREELPVGELLPVRS